MEHKQLVTAVQNLGGIQDSYIAFLTNNPSRYCISFQVKGP